MTKSQLTTPVAFIIFNRPDTTARVFEAIRQAQPPKLLVVADGPRGDHPEDVEKCAAARAIIERVDWDCEVLRNFAETNMGCKHRVSSGLDWVFETVEEAIILEDDCLPHPTFFRFCEVLLRQYRHDQRVMIISGSNLLGKWRSNSQSYHFSYYGGIWGWASWRRSWNYFDVNMKGWAIPEVKHRIRDVLCDPEQYQWRKRLFDGVYSGQIDSWDYAWNFARLLQSGLAIVPSLNLIKNIGFGAGATHTSGSGHFASKLSLHSMVFPLKDPPGVTVDRDYDRRFYLRQKKGLARRILGKLARILSKI
jgi:hypothetical protein